jgi:uracil-DNA glycosylase family 4
MDREIHHCKEIASKPVSFFFQEGSSPLGKKILIVGESLAKNGWVESGKAFYTTDGKLVPTGKRLNEELSLLDISLEECAFTEIAKCYIGKNRKQLSVCGSLCAQHFIAQLNHFKPTIIVSLGVVTKNVLEELFKTSLPIGNISSVTCRDKSYLILPMYHPSPANPFGHGKNMKIISSLQNELTRTLK